MLSDASVSFLLGGTPVSIQTHWKLRLYLLFFPFSSSPPRSLASSSRASPNESSALFATVLRRFCCPPFLLSRVVKFSQTRRIKFPHLRRENLICLCGRRCRRRREEEKTTESFVAYRARVMFELRNFCERTNSLKRIVRVLPPRRSRSESSFRISVCILWSTAEYKLCRRYRSERSRVEIARCPDTQTRDKVLTSARLLPRAHSKRATRYVSVIDITIYHDSPLT